MTQEKTNNTTGTVTRRAALLRLGLGSVVAYSVPGFLTLSEARASGPSHGGGGGGGGGKGGGGGNGNGKGGGGRTKPAVSGREPELDLCANPARAPGGSSMSKRDTRRAQKAVASGRAMPLRDVIISVQRKIGGRVLEVRFDDNWHQPTYDLRMISGKGNLVAVRVRAATGSIMKMSGC